MPQAIIPAVIGAGATLIAGNSANKANQAAASNAQSSAQQFDAQQQAQAFAQLQQLRQQALQQLQQYMQANPNPITGWGPIVGPYDGAPASVGGGMLGAGGSGGFNPATGQEMTTPPSFNGPQTPQFSGNPDLNIALYQALQAAMPKPAPTPAPAPARPSVPRDPITGQPVGIGANGGVIGPMPRLGTGGFYNPRAQ